MFPISKRAQATIIAAVVLSLTLLAIPAQAAGPRAFQAQETTTWSLFSWSFWQDAFSPVLGWFQGQDHQTTAQRADGPRSLFDRASGYLEPDGVAAVSATPVTPTLTDTGIN